MMLGTAAIRSTMETKVAFNFAGAYSLMNRAHASASGNAVAMPTLATVKVPTRIDRMPTTSESGFHSVSVKKLRP
jgi:hypothetical protein